MMPTDLADVGNYVFLINGKTPNQNWTGLFKQGERVRLRFINASAMTIYDVRIPRLKMQVVQADGQPIVPVEVDEFRFGVAETYDVVVTPTNEDAYTIVAESIDRTGFALGTLAVRLGQHGAKPVDRKRTLLTMADMGMGHSGHDGHNNPNSRGAHASHTGHGAHNASPNHAQSKNTSSGWGDADVPIGHKQLQYADLQYLTQQPDTREPTREIIIRLGGNMERYIWTMNGVKYDHAPPITVKYNERVRIKFINETMMAHPMHLHGMFVQLENGQPISMQPNKHTIIIPPGQERSALLTANEPGEWAFHCHLLYHMMSGMMRNLVVSESNLVQDAHTHE